MALSWSGRRQLMYYGLAFVIIACVVYAVWANFFNAAPTCFDGKQDGTELGVDCGGSCALLCQNTSQQPTVAWARSFSNANNTYTLAAYIQNNNVGAGAKAVPYTFQLFDSDNSLIKEVNGSVDIPPVPNVPLVVPNVSAGNRIVAHVEFAFGAEPVWYKVPEKSLPQLTISQQNLAADGSRLSTVISNQTLNDANNEYAVAVLFDADGVARAASKSYIAKISAQGQEQVTFTWPQGTPNIVRAEITLLPSF